MHTAARNFVRSVARFATGRVAEIGSRNVNGSVRYLIDARRYVGVDLREGPGVDIVADGATWDGDGYKYDAVVCCEVLEHSGSQPELCRNIMALLVPGGIAIITAATPDRQPHSGIDGGPLQDGEDYRGVTADDLRRWLDGCAAVMIDTRTHGDIYALVMK